MTSWSTRDIAPGEVLGGTYKVCERIGAGAFGTIHAAMQLAPAKQGGPQTGGVAAVSGFDAPARGGVSSASANSAGGKATNDKDNDGEAAPQKQVRLPPRPVAVKQITGPELADAPVGQAAAVREVQFLSQLSADESSRHPHIVSLYNVLVDRGRLFLVLELCGVDLNVIITGGRGGSGAADSCAAAAAPQPSSSLPAKRLPALPALPAADVKTYARAVLSAVAHCHAHGVVHMDIKPDNFFLSAGGALKLGDFGLARQARSSLAPGERLRARACVWYRPLEVLYGSKVFGPEADAWAAGCVLAELALRRPLFPGEREISVLMQIIQVVGAPSDETWPGVSSLPCFFPMGTPPGTPPRTLAMLFSAGGPEPGLGPDPGSSSGAGACAVPAATAGFAELVEALLRPNPADRTTAEAALRMNYFTALPAPTPPPALLALKQYDNGLSPLLMQQQQQQRQLQQQRLPEPQCAPVTAAPGEKMSQNRRAQHPLSEDGPVGTAVTNAARASSEEAARLPQPGSAAAVRRALLF